MKRRVYKSWIPPDAAEVVTERYPGGAKKEASYFLGAEKVGARFWDEEGWLEWEMPMRGGVRHGDEYRFYPNGQVLEKEPYRDGHLHGLGKQWSEDGRLLVMWKLTQGTGLDLWCDTHTETLDEENYWPREGEIGYKRWWNSDERTIWQEYFYVLGKGYHGVWREWNQRGRLRRGFPHFYVNDVKVARRQYLRACQDDPTLLPYRPEEDAPQRPLPDQYLAQRRRRPG